MDTIIGKQKRLNKRLLNLVLFGIIYTYFERETFTMKQKVQFNAQEIQDLIFAAEIGACHLTGASALKADRIIEVAKERANVSQLFRHVTDKGYVVHISGFHIDSVQVSTKKGRSKCYSHEEFNRLFEELTHDYN